MMTVKRGYGRFPGGVFPGLLSGLIGAACCLAVSAALVMLPAGAKAAEISIAKMAKLADAPYFTGKSKKRDKATPDGFTFLHHFEKNNGLEAALFEEDATGKIVFAIAGTQFSDPKDLAADLGLANKEFKHALRHFSDHMVDDAKFIPKTARKGVKEAFHVLFNLSKKKKKSELEKVMGGGPKISAKLKKQVDAALALVDKVATSFKKRDGKTAIKLSDIVVTGHSLGGYITQVVTAKKKVKRGVTFNAPGAAAYLKGAHPTRNLTNHSRKSDLVGNFGKHVGTLYHYKNAKFKWEKLHKAIFIQNHSMTEFRRDIKKGAKGKKVS